MKLYKVFDTLNEANSLTRIFNLPYKYAVQITFDGEKLIAENRTQFYIQMRELGYMTETSIDFMNADIKNYKWNPITVELGKTTIYIELIKRSK